MNTQNSQPDEIAYKLLDEFSREDSVSQRALADRLGIALGLVNAYIKRLCKKGHIKIKALPRNRIKYIITPQGFTEKTRLAYKFMHYSILYFKDTRKKIERTYEVMLKSGIEKVLLFGDGELAELCYISTRGFPLKIVGVVGKRRIEGGFFDCDVFVEDDIPDIDFDAIFVSLLEEKQGNLFHEAGIDPAKIFYLAN
jgi:DNA-binding MarR family transcriptional regulator